MPGLDKSRLYYLLYGWVNPSRHEQMIATSQDIAQTNEGGYVVVDPVQYGYYVSKSFCLLVISSGLSVQTLNTMDLASVFWDPAMS